MSTAFICSVNRELFFFDVILLSVLKKVSLTLRHIINDIEQNLRQVSFAGHRSQATGHCFAGAESVPGTFGGWPWA